MMYRLLEIPVEEGNDTLWKSLYELIASMMPHVKDPKAFREASRVINRLMNRREYLILKEEKPVGIWQYDIQDKGLPTEEGAFDYWLMEEQEGEDFVEFFKKTLTDQMEAGAHRRVIFYTNKESSRKLMDRLGLIPVNTLEFFELPVDQINEAASEQWMTRFAPEQYGLHAEFIPEPREEWIPAVAALETICANGMMRQDYSWKTVKTPQLLKDQLELDRVLGNQMLYCLLWNEQGELLGVSKVSRGIKRPQKVKQRLTGVHPDQRGKGLGKWLKVAMIKEVLTRFPEVTHFQTGSLIGNIPMRKVNAAIGYKLTGEQEWEFLIPKENLS